MHPYIYIFFSAQLVKVQMTSDTLESGSAHCRPLVHWRISWFSSDSTKML